MKLHYLDLSDYGRYAAPDVRDRFIVTDAKTTQGYVMTSESLFSYFQIDGFTIDVFSGIRVLASTVHPKSLHAEFRIAQGGLWIATWHKPVVKRLFWFGYALSLTTHLTPKLEERMSVLINDPIDGLPRSILLS